MIDKICISKDEQWYEAWPDVVKTQNQKLICVFSDCRHHDDRTYTRIVYRTSLDSGKTWSDKFFLTEGTEDTGYFYNCARINRLSSGRLVVTVDKLPMSAWGETNLDDTQVMSCYSDDNGEHWSKLQAMPLHGIVPERMTELLSGRLILAAHRRYNGKLAEFTCFSDDGGRNWSPERILAADTELHLCEVSLLPMGKNTVVGLLRENSCDGKDCYKVLSMDGGETWSKPARFPLPGCHRPTAGFLKNGKVFISYRYIPVGGAQLFFCAATDEKSLLSEVRSEANVRMIQLDYDRGIRQDTGYSGWLELDDGTLFIVNYITDDWPRGQIRGYFFDPAILFVNNKNN